MKTTIDAVGRVVIPKAIRDQAGLGPGASVDIRYENGQIEIEPLFAPVALTREGQFLVATAQSDLPPITSDQIKNLLQGLRQRDDVT